MKEYIINETLARMERRAEIALKHVSEDNDPKKTEGWKRAVKHYTCAAEALKEIKKYRAIGTIEECRKALNKLAEYEDLEKQGRLLNFPCAVGDTVYRIYKATAASPNGVYKCRVTGVKQEYNSTSIRLYANINKENYSIWIDNWFDKCQMGYEFFLTEQEAEQAIQKAKEGTND